MMRRIFMLLFVVGIATSIWAEPVSKNQALRLAQQFFLQKGKSQVLVQAETPMSNARARGKQTPDYYYVFNAGHNQGFVIVSGDDRTPEILAYSDHGSFNVDQIPSNMDGWLQGYAEQIRYIQDHRISNANRTRLIRKAPIAPLLTSHWDQHSPFNDDCGFELSFGPVDAVTGCVSTAMAQVMYYYKYPAQTLADIPSYQVRYNGTDLHTFEGVPAGTVLDWDNMLDSYPVTPVAGTEVQRAAVANLLSVVGKSIMTTYSNNSSSAFNYRVADALKNYFGYAQNVSYKQRWGYTNDEWEAILYQELSSGRPIVYGGQTSDDPNSKQGHCFVIDGYADGGFYHVNWGWGQLDESPDGYFLLSAMDPPLEGAGGGDGAYNYGHDAIVGIDYQDVGPVTEIVRLATTSLTVNGGTDEVVVTKGESFTIAFNVMSRRINTYDFYIALGLYQNDEFVRDIGQTWWISNFTSNGYNTSPLSQEFNLTALANGQYKIIPISKEAETDTWYENERSDEFYISLEITDTQIKLSVGKAGDEPGPEPEPEVTDADRTELAGIYATLKSSVETKQALVTTNENTIAALKAAADEKNTQITASRTKITAIEEKLNNDLLTDKQKTDYAEELASLSQWCDQSELDVKDATETIAALESENTTLKTQLATIIGQIETQAAAVAGITTAEALAASKVIAGNLKTQLDGSDVTTIKTQIDSVWELLSDVSPADIDAAIKTLDEGIDAAIEEARKAAEEQKEKEEQEEKEKFEAAKAALKAALDDLKKAADEKTAEVAANEQYLATLNAAIATAQEAVKPIDTKIAAIQEKLKSPYLTDAQRTDYTTQLTALEAEKAAYVSHLSDISRELQDATEANTALKKELADISKAIQEQSDAVAGITTNDALETAKAKAEETEVQLQLYVVLTLGVEEIETTLAGLSLDSTSTALATLEGAIDKAIADAIAAAQSEQEKAELDAAKQEVQSSLDALKTGLAEAKDKIAMGEASLSELVAAIKKGQETLAALKAKAAEIEALLAPSSVRTRADMSDDQRATFVKQLQGLNAKIKDLEEKLAVLTEAEQSLEAKVKEAKDLVQSVENGIGSAETSLSTVATAAAATALKDTLVELEKNLAAIDTTVDQVLVDLAIQDNEMSAFVEDASAAGEDAAAIFEDVEETISGIEAVTLDESDIYGRYDLNGQRVDENYKGVMIIKMNDGKSHVIIKRK